MLKNKCSYCYEIKRSKHNCDFSKVKIEKNEFINYSQALESKNKTIQYLTDTINKINLQLTQYKTTFRELSFHIKPLLDDVEPKTFEDIIMNSNWDKKTKMSHIKLFDEYTKWCSNNLNLTEDEENLIEGSKGNHRYNSGLNANNNDTGQIIQNQIRHKGEIYISIDKEQSKIKDVYNPENAFVFVTKVKKYNRTTLNHRLRLFLKVIKKATKNHNLEYSGFSGNAAPPKIKHLVTSSEIENFIKFLKNRKLFVILTIVEMLFKFGVRIGSIAKLKYRHYMKENKILHFPEKNNKVIKRKVLEGLQSKLDVLTAKIQEPNYYIFFPMIHPDNIDKRCKFFSNLIIKHIKASKAFEIHNEEAFCAHMFRATHGTTIMLEKGVEEARLELGHSNINTTLRSYIRPEDRDIFVDSQTRVFGGKEDLFSLSRNKKKPKKTIEKIIDKKIIDGNLYYQVKWANSNRMTTWESAISLLGCESHIENYNQLQQHKEIDINQCESIHEPVIVEKDEDCSDSAYQDEDYYSDDDNNPIYSINNANLINEVFLDNTNLIKAIDPNNQSDEFYSKQNEINSTKRRLTNNEDNKVEYYHIYIVNT